MNSSTTSCSTPTRSCCLSRTRPVSGSGTLYTRIIAPYRPISRCRHLVDEAYSTTLTRPSSPARPPDNARPWSAPAGDPRNPGYRARKISENGKSGAGPARGYARIRPKFPRPESETTRTWSSAARRRPEARIDPVCAPVGAPRGAADDAGRAHGPIRNRTLVPSSAI